MLGAMNFRTYIVVTVVVAASLALIGWLVGESIITFFDQMRADAVSVGLAPGLADLIVEPMKFIFQPDSLIGAILAALLWPLAALWTLLFILMAVFSFVSPGVNTAADTIR